jgi:hypothetical protein
MSKTGFQRAGDLVAVHGKRGNAEGPHRPPHGRSKIMM